MRFSALTLAALVMIACSRDPNYLKQKYLESGNKYFAAKRYKEASIMYRKSLEKDRRFGPAWYHLALTQMQLGQVASAVPALHRAYELLKPGTPDSDDASLKLGEIEVLAASSQQQNEQYVDEITQIKDGLLKRNPNSWQGHKLTGDLDMLQASMKMRAGQGAAAKHEVEDAIAEYRKTMGLKSGYDPVIAVALGHALESDGQINDAEAMFLRLIDNDKTYLQGYAELYRIYLAERKLDQAEAILKRGISGNPKDASLRLALARFYFSEGRRNELLGQLDQMKANLKEFPQAYVQSGDFFLRMGSYDEAVKQYEEGIIKDPSGKNTYLKHEIEAYVAQGKMPVAYEKAEQILKNDPKDPDARELKATFMLDKGDVNQALQELQSVVTARPNNFVAHFNLGRAHFARQEYDEARQEFETTLQLQPGYSPARLALTQVAMLRGDNEMALRSAQELLRMVPNSIQGRVMEASSLERLGRMDEARKVLEAVLAKQPNQPDTLLELGILNLNEKKYKDAEQIFAKAYAVTPSPANLRSLLGESTAYRLDGQVDKSVELLEQEVAKNPGRLDLEKELGNVQASAGQLDAAIQTFNAVLSKTTDTRTRGDLLTRIGQAYRLKRDTQHSIEALTQAAKDLPDNPAILTNLGELYSDENDFKTSRRYYESALKLEPNNAVALNNLAYLIAETNGDLDLALTYATRAKQRMPNYPQVSDTLGWIYIKKNLTDSAIDTFKRLVVQAPQEPVYHYHYAMALMQKGDRDTARKECEAALADKHTSSQEQEIRQLMQKLS